MGFQIFWCSFKVTQTRKTGKINTHFSISVPIILAMLTVLAQLRLILKFNLVHFNFFLFPFLQVQFSKKFQGAHWYIFYDNLKFYFFFNFILFLNLKHCISFAKHQNESTTGFKVTYFIFNLLCWFNYIKAEISTHF